MPRSKEKESVNVFCAQVKERKGKCVKGTVFNLIKTVRFKLGRSSRLNSGEIAALNCKICKLVHGAILID